MRFKSMGVLSQGALKYRYTEYEVDLDSWNTLCAQSEGLNGLLYGEVQRVLNSYAPFDPSKSKLYTELPRRGARS
jgi:hypothetical protein